MNILAPNSVTQTVKKADTPLKDQSSSLGLKTSKVPQPTSPFPFYLHCLGGNWEGQAWVLRPGYLNLCMNGFPPVDFLHALQFQSFGPGHAQLSPMQSGSIQEIHIHPGSSVWEGTTEILVEYRTMHSRPRESHGRTEEPFSPQCGNFMIGKVLDEVRGPLSQTGEPDHHATPWHSSVPMKGKGGETEEASILTTIQSTRLAMKNDNGQMIMAYHDFPAEVDLSTLPIVVIVPGYGETKRDYLILAYYFASNGFQVVRYDHTNHVGESEGDHYDISLSSMKEDFKSVTQFVSQQWPHCPVIGVASSLASRVVLKAEVECPTLSFLVSLVGIVNVQRSVTTVHQEDVFSNYLNGQVQESANILGFNVSRYFLEDALKHKFATLETTIEDINSLKTPVMLVSAGKDVWVDPHDLQTVGEALDGRLSKWLVVPEALHRLQENPKIARATYQQVLEHCRAQLALSSEGQGVHDPNRLDLGRQNRREKTSLQSQSLMDVGSSFWQDYLGHFQSVGKCQDYVKLLDHVFHALGSITPGQQFLDAGCGNGNAGLFFLRTLQQSMSHDHPVGHEPIRYVGIDLVTEALGRAQQHMTQTMTALEKTAALPLPSFHMSWAQVDLQDPLPFADNQFDRIVSNLVLGYVADPQTTLRELYRVLAPGGRMVLSNLKPNGDFSGIYQSLVNRVDQPQQREEARELLNNYGKIRQAEKEGQFRFFDRIEWAAILEALGCVYGGVYPTFANQAFLIVLEKPITSTRVMRPSNPTPSAIQSIPPVPAVLKRVA